MSIVAIQPEPSKVASPSDYRDLLIADLVDAEHERRRRLAEVIGEGDTYRELLAVALERLHQLVVKLGRAQDSLRRLLEVERDARVRPKAPAGAEARRGVTRGDDSLKRLAVPSGLGHRDSIPPPRYTRLRAPAARAGASRDLAEKSIDASLP